MPGQVTPEQAVLMLCAFLLLLAAGAAVQDWWHRRREDDGPQPEAKRLARLRGQDPWEWDVDARRELPWRPGPGERPVPLHMVPDATLDDLLGDYQYRARAELAAAEDHAFLMGSGARPWWRNFRS